MLETITQKRGASEEEGFTLIELVVVVAIIGILTAIAIPAYGWMQTWTKNNAFDANNRQMQTAFQARFIQAGGSFVSYDPADSAATGPAFTANMNLLREVGEEMMAESLADQRDESGALLPLEDTPNGYWVGYAAATSTDSNGVQTLNPCFYTWNEDLGRTLCYDGSNRNGPDFGADDYR